MDTEFADAPDESRFELRSGDGLVGFITYHLRDDVITMAHTEVDPAHSGQGHAATLARGTLDAVRERGLRVNPACAFVASYMKKNPQYADLLA